MGNALSGKELLPDPVCLALCNIEKVEQDWVVEAVTRNAAACPELDLHGIGTARGHHDV